jgi:hypothetical protein
VALGQLNVGDLLSFAIRNGHIELVDGAGISVARLSKSAKNMWTEDLNTVHHAKVIAMVRRYRNSISDEAFKAGCFGEMWEVPLVEVCAG